MEESRKGRRPPRGAGSWSAAAAGLAVWCALLALLAQAGRAATHEARAWAEQEPARGAGLLLHDVRWSRGPRGAELLVAEARSLRLGRHTLGPFGIGPALVPEATGVRVRGVAPGGGEARAYAREARLARGALVLRGDVRAWDPSGRLARPRELVWPLRPTAR